MSKDPRTQVGAVIVGPDLEVRSTGFNGFPRGIVDWPERLQDKPTKLRLIVHAEVPATGGLTRRGTSNRRSTGCRRKCRWPTT